MTQGKLGDDGQSVDIESGGLSIDYQYDNADRVIRLSYVKQDTMRNLIYDYDNFGRLKYIKLALGDQETKIVREYVHKTNGDLNYTKDFRQFTDDGTSYIKTAYEINSAGLTTKITYTDHANSSQTGVKKEEYSLGYDDRGFITSETAYTSYGEAKTVNKSYEYDAIGRLAQATIGDKTNIYTYDDVGNRETMDDGEYKYIYEYDQFNRLLEIDKKDLDTHKQ